MFGWKNRKNIHENSPLGMGTPYLLFEKQLRSSAPIRNISEYMNDCQHSGDSQHLLDIDSVLNVDRNTTCCCAPSVNMSCVHPERKDESFLKSDTSGSESSSSLDALKTPKPIIVKGVSSHTLDAVEAFLENPYKGGGLIKEVEFNE